MSSHDGKMWIFLTWVWGNPLGGYDTESTPPELSRSDFACEDFFLGKIVILEDQKSANDSLKVIKFFWSSHSRKSQEGKFSSLWKKNSGVRYFHDGNHQKFCANANSNFEERFIFTIFFKNEWNIFGNLYLPYFCVNFVKEKFNNISILWKSLSFEMRN